VSALPALLVTLFVALQLRGTAPAQPS
jgi:hypothetical protein